MHVKFQYALTVVDLEIRVTIMDLYCYQDNWKRYRSTLENILLEIDRYLAKTDQYAEGDFNSQKKLLVSRISGITSSELKDWEDLRNKEKESAQKS